MKYAFAALLALMLAFSAASVGEGVNPADLYVGRWADERVETAWMDITTEYVEMEGSDYLVLFPIRFTWERSGGRRVEWTMTARHDEGTNRLGYEDGAKEEIDSGARQSLWTGAGGSLSLDASGTLTWNDQRETDSRKLSFRRVIAPAPAPAALADGFFRPVAGIEQGTAGALMKAAQVIVGVLQFAKDQNIWITDPEELRASLRAAWESLTDLERERFEAVFDDAVSDPADEAFDDYSSLKSVFQDAGVGPEMGRLTRDGVARLCWETLSSAVLGMDADAGDYDGEVLG